MPIILLFITMSLISFTTIAWSGSDEADNTSANSTFFLQKIFVENIKFIGNQTIPEEELTAISRPYHRTYMSFEQLQALSQKLSYHLINKGYANSGVFIPDQQVNQGIVTFQVVEGKVSAIEISGNKRLSNHYIEQTLRPFIETPVNIYKVRQGLQLLQQNPRIKKVNAHLKPDLMAGEGILQLKVEEDKPQQLWLEFSNDYSPSIGSYGAKINFLHNNLVGFGDTFFANIAATDDDGLLQYELDYTYPLLVEKLNIRFYLQKNDTRVVEYPFNELDIKSDSDTFGLSLSHTLQHLPDRQFDLGLSAEVRKSESRLLDREHNLITGSEQSDANISVLRWFQSWSHRSQDRVMAAHSSFNTGLDVFNATAEEHGLQNRFLSWTGQFQYLQRLKNSDKQLLLKAYGQFSRDHLLPMEQISLGGLSTVRGYRTNELVGDNGYALSIALRIPVYQNTRQQSLIELEPFSDYGKVWHSDTLNDQSASIASAGVGLRWQLKKSIDFFLYAAKALKKREHSEKDLQDEGIHFSLSLHL